VCSGNLGEGRKEAIKIDEQKIIVQVILEIQYIFNKRPIQMETATV
jgi:hypothetical protein